MKMKYLGMVAAGLLVLITSCTKDNFISTGNSNGRFDGSTMAYLEAHSYDWDSTVVMIRHAGPEMVALFEGKDENHREITFFGMTNFSILRYLLQEDKTRVSDLDPDWCKSILLQHVVDKKHFRTDFPAGDPGEAGTVGTGGVMLTTLGGTTIWTYIVVQESGGIVDNASKPISVRFSKSGKNFGVASGDLEQDNGVVHALEYWFTLGDEEKK